MSNETIFREVDEELRGDRLRAFWKRFGPYVIGAAVAVIVIVAVNEGWTWWQNSNSARASDEFYAALELAEGGDLAAAQGALDQVAAKGHGGYPTLAQFRQASLLARDGKADEALAAYDSLSTTVTDPRLRELALVFAAFLVADKGDVAAVEQRVGSLAAEGSPLRNAAREAIGLTQYKAGDLLAARTTLEQVLADPLASRDSRSRVQIYIAQLIALGATTPEEEAAALEAPAAAPAADAAPAEAAPAEAVEPAVETPAEPVAEPATEPAAEPAPAN